MRTYKSLGYKESSDSKKNARAVISSFIMLRATFPGIEAMREERRKQARNEEFWTSTRQRVSENERKGQIEFEAFTKQILILPNTTLPFENEMKNLNCMYT